MSKNISIVATGEKRYSDGDKRDKEIYEKLKLLHLSGMIARYRELIDEGKIKDLMPDEFLLELINSQLELRVNNSAARRMREGNFWYTSATLDNLYGSLKLVPQTILADITRFNFIANGGYVAILGSHSCGLTYLSCAIGAIACKKGIQTHYVKLSHLINPALAELREESICNDLSLLRRTKLLIIDDWLDNIVDSSGVEKILEVLQYRNTDKGTILVSHCDQRGWKDRLNGFPGNVKKILNYINTVSKIVVPSPRDNAKENEGSTNE